METDYLAKIRGKVSRRVQLYLDRAVIDKPIEQLSDEEISGIYGIGSKGLSEIHEALGETMMIRIKPSDHAFIKKMSDKRGLHMSEALHIAIGQQTSGHPLNKIKVHLLTLPRWIFLPFFLLCMLTAIVLAKGNLWSVNTLLAFLTVSFLVAGGHSFNTLLDTVMTKLDDPKHEHSVEKSYAAGSVVISEGLASPKEVLINAISWYLLALIPGIILAIRVTPFILIPIFFGMCVTFFYSPSKWTFFHETVLALGVVAAAVIGSLSTGTGEWVRPILITIPLCLIFSFAGLGLDEYKDAEANLKQGVKSLAYQVWKQDFDLSLYIMLWVFLAYMVQIFFITIGWLKPLTGLTFIALPFAIAASVFLKKEATFKKAALVMVVVAMLYPIMMLIGQVL